MKSKTDMEMSAQEVAIWYRRAKNRKRQIKILAQLNDVPERVIREVLMDQGEKVPDNEEKRRYIKQKNDIARHLMELGCADKDIATICGVQDKTVRRWRSHNGD